MFGHARHWFIVAVSAAALLVPLVGVPAQAATTAPKYCVGIAKAPVVKYGGSVNLYARNHRCVALGGSWWVFQTDGNLVFYRKGKVLWASHTARRGYRLSLQKDANLVIYNKRGKALWATHTNRAHNLEKKKGTDIAVGFSGKSATSITRWDIDQSPNGCACGWTIWSSQGGLN